MSNTFLTPLPKTNSRKTFRYKFKIKNFIHPVISLQNRTEKNIFTHETLSTEAKYHYNPAGLEPSRYKDSPTAIKRGGGGTD